MSKQQNKLANKQLKICQQRLMKLGLRAIGASGTNFISHQALLTDVLLFVDGSVLLLAS